MSFSGEVLLEMFPWSGPMGVLWRCSPEVELLKSHLEGSTGGGNFEGVNWRGSTWGVLRNRSAEGGTLEGVKWRGPREGVPSPGWSPGGRQDGSIFVGPLEVFSGGVH